MKNNKINAIMRIGVVLAVLVALYAALTYGQGVIHSDSSVTNRLYKSMCTSHGFYPKTWNFYNYELYSFTIQNIGAYIQFFIKDTIIARVIASVLVLLLACYSIVWFSKKIFNDDSYLISIPAMFVFMSGVNYRDMFLYQADYVIQVIVITLCYGMAYKIINETDSQLKYKIIHTIVLFVLMVGGMRYGAEYVLPFSCMVGINWIILLLKKEKKEVFDLTKRYILLFFVPAVVGFALYKYVCYTHAAHILGNQVGTLSAAASFSVIKANIVSTVFNLFSSFGFDSRGALVINIIAIIVSLILFVVVPVIQIVDFKKLSKAERDYTIFALSHNIIMLLVVILGTKTFQRYLFTSVFVAVIVSSNCLTRKILSRNSRISYIFAVLCLLLTLFYSQDLILSTLQWKQMVAKQEEQCKQLLDKGITKVYASYWIAYPFETYSNNKITAGALNLKPRSLEKNYILVDDSAFEPIKGKSAIVMTQDEADVHSNMVHVMCGQQDEDFLIKNAIVSNNENYFVSDLVVFVYNNDIGNKLSDGFKDGMLGIKEMDFNWYGTMTEDTIILEENGMIHGPYSFLEKGHYSLRIEGKGLVGCNCAVISDISQDSISFFVNDIQEDHIDIDLTLDGGIEDLQVYLSNLMPNKTVEFYDIKVTKL